mgnify:CR=1 FL=1
MALRLPRLSIKARLLAALVAIALSALSLGFSGWLLLSQSTERMADLYSHRLEPIVALQHISGRYQVDIAGSLQKLNSGAMDWIQTWQNVRLALSDIRDSWGAYRARPINNEDERRLVEDVDKVLAEANAAVDALLDILAKRDEDALATFRRERLTQEIWPASDALTTLLELERDLAAKTFADNGQAFVKARSLIRSLVVVAVVIVLLGTVTILNGVSRPLTRITAAMRAVADGDLSVAVPYVDRRDEIGLLASALEIFKENRQRAESLTAQQREETERRLQRQQTVEQAIAEFDSLLSGALETLNSSAVELRATAQNMNHIADLTDTRAATVAETSQQVALNIQTLAATAEELSASIGEIGRQGAHSAQIAQNALHSAEQTNTQVQSLADAAQRIGDVVTLINDIAAQTNLLALNATIEAARAGDAGKGFAVVASEVKSLANQTAKATEEVAAQIAAIQNATHEAIGAIQNIGTTIREITEIAEVIAQQVREQSNATQEMAHNIAQTATKTQEVTQTAAEVRDSAAETGSAAGQVLSAADELAHQGVSLREEVGRFMTKLRSA